MEEADRGAAATGLGRRGRKGCELCKAAPAAPARVLCESDQAMLCWDCDAAVHGANFLVARHSRCLLCRCCQAPTPWRASGARLGPTVSLCDGCEARESTPSGELSEGSAEGEEERRSYSDLGSGMEGEGENQVVPWKMPPLPAVAAAASSSSSEESSSNRPFKRRRETADILSQEQRSCWRSSGSGDRKSSRSRNRRLARPMGSPRELQPNTAACNPAVLPVPEQEQLQLRSSKLLKLKRKATHDGHH